MIDPQLNGKVALITGANHGIGAATASALAQQGVRVLVQYLRLEDETTDTDAAAPLPYQRNRAKDATAVLTQLRAIGGEAEAIESDLADPANIPLLFDRAEQLFGPVNILINNATHWQADSFLPSDRATAKLWPPASPQVTSESITNHLVVNSRGVALMMAEFANRHISRGANWGRIINLSTGGAYSFPSEVSYGASKLAIESYSRSAAVELGPYGITVNIVSPGATQTGWIDDALAANIAAHTPLRRVGQPDDIADVIVFLTSHQARWLTGQTLHVGGGDKMLSTPLIPAIFNPYWRTSLHPTQPTQHPPVGAHRRAPNSWKSKIPSILR